MMTLRSIDMSSSFLLNAHKNMAEHTLLNLVQTSHAATSAWVSGLTHDSLNGLSSPAPSPICTMSAVLMPIDTEHANSWSQLVSSALEVVIGVTSPLQN